MEAAKNSLKADQSLFYYLSYLASITSFLFLLIARSKFNYIHKKSCDNDTILLTTLCQINMIKAVKIMIVGTSTTGQYFHHDYNSPGKLFFTKISLSIWFWSNRVKMHAWIWAIGSGMTKWWGILHQHDQCIIITRCKLASHCDVFWLGSQESKS